METQGAASARAFRKPVIMSEGTVANRGNLDAIEDAYRRWKQDPSSVDESWRYFFEGFELGSVRPAGAGLRRGRIPPANRRHPPHLRLPRSRAFSRPPRSPQRARGKLSRCWSLSEFGLSEADMDRVFDTSPFIGLPRASLRELAQGACAKPTAAPSASSTCTSRTRASAAGCRSAWSRAAIGPASTTPRRLRILKSLHYAELFEQFPANPLHRPEALLAGRRRDARSRAGGDRRKGARTT